MGRIGFKTEAMKREERMPVVYEAKKIVITEAVADTIIGIRLKEKAVEFVERYMTQPFDCFSSFSQELKDLRKLYKNLQK